MKFPFRLAYLAGALMVCASARADLTHRYSFTNDASDSIGGADGVLVGSASISSNAVVLPGSGSYVDLPDGLLGSYSSITLELWVTDIGSGPWARVYDFGNDTTHYLFVTLPSGNGNLRGVYRNGGGEQIVEWPGGRPSVGQKAHIVWTTDPATLVGRLYVDGVQVGVNSNLTISPAAIGPTANNWLGRSQFGNDPYFLGTIDEFRIYDTVLSPEEVLVDYQGGPERIPIGPVNFVRQPLSQSVTEQQSVTFTADASGEPPLFVQWYRNGVLLDGATNFSLTFIAAISDSNSVYQVWVTNVFNSVTYEAGSSNATLLVFADTNPPVLLRAQSVSTNGVNVLFSEPLLTGTATNQANYTLNGPGGAVTINSASLDPIGATVTLATAPLLSGSNYTLIVSGVRDRSSVSNLIAPGSQAAFIATPYTLVDIGAPAIAGTFLSASNGGFTLAAAGTGIGATADQCSLAYQNVTGNFDVQLRLGSLGLSDTWATAGLMARDGLASNAVFAASLATPGQAGSFFAARTTAGGTATQNGLFPVNYPDTWLRLRRVGSTFNGYASLDGRSWTLLGSASIAASATLQVGIALSSENAAQTTSAFFNNADNTVNTALNAAPLPFEAIGPSSRATGLVISEVMYHPKNPGTNSLEFIELYNSDLVFEDLGGYRLSGSIDFAFPPGTLLASGAYLVVARDPAAVQSFYGISGVLGPWTNNLPNDNGTVRLRNELDSVLLEIDYDTDLPWPAAPDGTGHSLALRRPSFGEDNPRAWAPSDVIGGSPGSGDYYGYEPLRVVVINEFLAHTDLPDLDAIELFNTSTQSLDLAGCVITDDPDTNKFVIGSVTIPGRGHVSFNETQLGFRLDAAGETIYLKNPSGTRVLDAVRFDAQQNGVSFGRYPSGSDQWYRLSSRTFGTPNAAPLFSQVGINEIMYHPLSGSDDDQFVELYNRGTNAVNLGGWTLTAGISFTFPSNTIIGATNYLVIANNVSRLLANYPGLNATNTLGNFGGTLAHGGERIALTMPDLLISTNGGGITTTNLISIVVDEVTYGDGGRWGQWSDGGGSSLELVDPRSNKRLAASWADSDESAKAPWTLVERTDLATLGMGDGTSGQGIPNRLEFFLQGPGECLVDDLEVRSNGGVNLVGNPGFESGTASWVFQGTHAHSFLETVLAPFSGSQSLHVLATERGDTGANRIRTAIATVPVNSGNQATLRTRARWLRGDPNLLLRLRGNWLECAGVMTVPANLGTPGARNSRYLANTGPAITDVSHFPALPAASTPVVVSARIEDPDGVASATLYYRVDPATTYSSSTMLDNGVGNDAYAQDRIYSATIPGQLSGTLVAFYVQAQDDRFPPVTTRFPADAPARECLVRFGESVRPGGMGNYRLWLTQSNVTYWTTREKNSNEELDATFVYGNSRVIYNAQTRYSGSPWHTPSYNGPLGTTVCNYDVHMPSDDLLLGADSFNLQGQSTNQGQTFNNDNSAQAETTAHWMARQLGIQPDYRRHIFVFLNGQQRGMVYYDYQQPDGDLVEEFFPDDADGHLHKIEDWFEFDDGGGGLNIITAKLVNHVVNGQKRTERYRWTFRPRAAEDPNDFADLYALVDAVNAPGPEPFTTAAATLADIPEWMSMFALQHMAGNWDTYGYRRGKNMYTYKPENGPWRLLLWDIQLVFGKSSDGVNQPLFDVGNTNDPGLGDPVVVRMYNHPPFVREFWNALRVLVNGPMLAANYNPLMDARYAALRAQGVPVQEPISVKNWINARRTFIVPQIPQASFAVNGPASFSSASNYITLTGTAPIDTGSILVNGAAYPLTWTTVTNWSLRIPLGTNGNSLVVQAVDRNGTVLSSNTINVNYTGGAVAPEGNVVFSEILYRPVLDGAGCVELFNSHSNYTFDLSNWRVNGLDYTFPPGATLPPRQFLVLAEDPYTYAIAYGATNVVFGGVDGRLDADGETLTLFRPASATNEIVVDRVRYEAVAPWSLAATNGTSLQLVDPAQDNSRVANWTIGTTNVPAPVTLMAYTNVWKYNQTNNLDGVNWTATGYNSAAWPSGRGLLAAESNPLITPLINTTLPAPNVPTNGMGAGHAYYFRATVNFPGNYVSFTASNYVDDGAVFYVNGAEVPTRIRMNSGAVTNATLASSAPPSNSDAEVPDTFSIPTSMFVQGTNVIAAEVHQVTTGSSDLVFGMSLTAVPVSGVRTPGTPNSVAATLPPFPPLWLNEVQADNVTGPLDNSSEHDPWVEIYNAGSNTISLAGYYLSDTYTNLTKFAFPAGVSIPSNSFLVVWCDNQTNQTAGSVVHTSFRLASGAGSVALARITNGGPQVVDYLNYVALPSNWSYGDAPDGQPFFRGRFFFSTPGGTNNPASAPITIRINEWLADNTYTIHDEADFDYEDWFELYNPGTNAVDLGGYYLTDNLTNKTQFLIPNNGHYVVPPQGFLLVWADGESGQNNTNRLDLHTSFALSKSGEAIGLFAADGTAIDAVTFGPQTNDASEGRFPDAAAPIYLMPTPTPRAPNVLPNTPPVLAAISNRTVILGQTLGFTASATDADLPLVFSLSGAPADASIDASSGAFTWTPTVAPSTNTMSVVVHDSGTPSLSSTQSFTVSVALPPALSDISLVGSQFSFGWPSVVDQFYQVEFTADLHDVNWQLLGVPLAGTGGFLFFTNDISAAPRRFFRVRVLSLGEALATPPTVQAAMNGNAIALRWTTFPGQRFQVEFKDNLLVPGWSPLGDVIVGTGGAAEISDMIVAPQRFYRIVVLP